MKLMSEKSRCEWVSPNLPLYRDYHDLEWGRPVVEDTKIFEFLCLEGAQAGLSWWTILQKRQRYREVFHNFKIERVAKFTPKKVDSLLQDPGIVRNRRKVESVIANAKACLEIQREYGSLYDFFWSYVNYKPLVNRPKNLKSVPAQTELSKQLSKDLKIRGFSFVGPTIVYAFMQAIGMVNDHTVNCFLHGAKFQ